MPKSVESLPDHDLELLSSYLDGELSARDRAAFEQRLAHEPALRRALEDTRATVSLVQQLPRLKAPRDFRLDPAAYAPRVPLGRRLFAFGNLLQLSGALGAAASVVIIVLAVILGADEAPRDVTPSSNVAMQPTLAVQAESAQRESEATASAPSTATAAPTLTPTALPTLSPMGTLAAPAPLLGAQEPMNDTAQAQAGQPLVNEPLVVPEGAQDGAALAAPPGAAAPAMPGDESLREGPPGAGGALPGAPQAAPAEQPVAPEAEAFSDTMEAGAAATTSGFAESATESAQAPLPETALDESAVPEMTAAALEAEQTSQKQDAAQESRVQTVAREEPDRRWLYVGVGAVALAISLGLWLIGTWRARP